MDIKKYLTPKYLLIGGIAVVGGLFLASKFRPKATTELAEVVATPVLQPYGVDSNPPEYAVTSPAPSGGTIAPLPGSDRPTPIPALPGPPPPSRGGNTMPAPQLPGTPQPTHPGMPQQPGIPGAPRREPTPVPPGAPPATANVPGGVPADCRDVQHRPADHPGTDVMALVRAKGGDRLARTIATEWAINGIANIPGALGLTEIVQWVNITPNWAIGNRSRRSRGLRALTTPEWQRLQTDLNTYWKVNLGKPLNDSQLQALWATYHVPYLCG